jgi:hypothetical protein
METPLRIRNVLFKAFIINLLLVVLVWLMSLSGAVAHLMAIFFGFSADQTRAYMADIIGFWRWPTSSFSLSPRSPSIGNTGRDDEDGTGLTHLPEGSRFSSAGFKDARIYRFAGVQRTTRPRNVMQQLCFHG